MDCPHIEKAALIQHLPEPTSTGIIAVPAADDVPDSEGQSSSELSSYEGNTSHPVWLCKTCSTEQSPWLCLSCGSIGCGRYVKAHAKQHFHESTSHSVCLEIHSLAAFCYACDEFVANDSPARHLESLRRQIRRRDGEADEVSVEEESPSEEIARGGSFPPGESAAAAAASESFSYLSATPGGSTTTRRRSHGVRENGVTLGASSPAARRRSSRILEKLGPEKRRSERICERNSKGKAKNRRKDGGKNKSVLSNEGTTTPRSELAGRKRDRRSVSVETNLEPKKPKRFNGDSQRRRRSKTRVNDEATGNSSVGAYGLILDSKTKSSSSSSASTASSSSSSSSLRNKALSQASNGTSSRSSTPTNKGHAHQNGNLVNISGLRNLGNTCFMNAVLQSLSNIQQFCGYMKGLPELSLAKKVNGKKKPEAVTTRYTQPKKNGERDGDDLLLAEELRKTLVALWQGDKTTISPQSLFQVVWRVVPQFRGYQQQDAHEFMRYLLDRLHSELLQRIPLPSTYGKSTSPRRKKMLLLKNSSSSSSTGSTDADAESWLSSAIKSRSTVVSLVFGGVLQNEVNCLDCGLESKKHDPFLDLSLDIPAKFLAKGSKTNGSRGSGRGGSLEALYSGSAESANQRRNGHGGVVVSREKTPVPKSGDTASEASSAPSLNGGDAASANADLSQFESGHMSDSLGSSIPNLVSDSQSSLNSAVNVSSQNTSSHASSSSSSSPRTCTLADCFESFIALEHLSDSELYFCPSCKKRQRSTKKFWVRRAPSVLCVHLKRFRWANFCRQKIDTFVDFPIRGLDLSDYMLHNLHGTRGSGRDNVYDLAAVIVHHGSGVGCGHYTAYATHEGRWFHFNDSTVSPTDDATVAKCKAYILFYIKREEKD